MTISVSTVAETMPPIIGTAMRRMIFEPVPVLQKIASSPAMIAVTVIIFGSTRSTAPSVMAAWTSCARHILTCGTAFGREDAVGMVEIDQHHHAGLRCHAGERDEADDDGDDEIEPS